MSGLAGLSSGTDQILERRELELLFSVETVSQSTKHSDLMMSESEASRIFKFVPRRDSSPSAQNDIATESLGGAEFSELAMVS